MNDAVQVALVTGASRGIGRALAVGLARAGYDLALCDLASQPEALAETARQVQAEGRSARTYDVDVSSKADTQRLVERVLADAGRIDVLVNNAGILKLSSLEDLDEATWDAHQDVNTRGVLFMCQAVLPHMRGRKAGRIVNIASLAGRQGVPGQGHYAVSKAGVITLTRVLAQEVGSDGITVNAVCPGIILTEMGRNNLGSEEAVKHWENATALHRLGDPEDVVGPVVFFASPQSAFVTGQALNVCGGLYFH
ncbi:SDR family NAD(P)-dependent oxidoreductase [Aureimonas sp. AU4]|uniref:SDR family NAD(P)-dependent oxidoreductase n=1 Tax=Aureimonas sp. AU4 TaxID=1638163 RepID=UPI000783FABF|nr:SDR family NAD(P)-dependent oxidoreductase [Aureimonas sp. AU4]